MMVDYMGNALDYFKLDVYVVLATGNIIGQKATCMHRVNMFTVGSSSGLADTVAGRESSFRSTEQTAEPTYTVSSDIKTWKMR